MKKNYRVLFKLIVVLMCLAAVYLLTLLSIRRMNLDETHFMYASINGVRINILTLDGQYCLFLPSFADEGSIEYSHEAQKHDIKVYRSENLPAVFITTNSGTLDNVLANKQYKEAGKITVINRDGTREHAGGLDYIKGRGNYSWNNWDKKPFKIKLGKTASLLDLGYGTDYCLIANASDATLIRNEIARRLEMQVGIPYASAGRFADLYINGEYLGNYYLCPSIEVGPDRIDITDMDEIQSKVVDRLNPDAISVYETASLKGWNLPDSLEDISGGYLVEREFADRYDLEYPSIKNGFITDRGEHFIVLSPQYCTVAEISYIAERFNSAEKAVFGEGDLSEYIDTDSFAKRYLVEEVLKNYDGGVSSAFYYKDTDQVDSRIFAGPGWDFDMSMGNYLDWMEYADEDATGITRLYLSEHSSIYYRELVKDETFMGLVRDSFNEKALPCLEQMLESGIDNYEKELSASAEMDSVRWSDMYLEKGYTTGDHSEYRSLKEFIANRLMFLKGEWSD